MPRGVNDRITILKVLGRWICIVVSKHGGVQFVSAEGSELPPSAERGEGLLSIMVQGVEFHLIN